MVIICYHEDDDDDDGSEKSSSAATMGYSYFVWNWVPTTLMLCNDGDDQKYVIMTERRDGRMRDYEIILFSKGPIKNVSIYIIL